MREAHEVTDEKIRKMTDLLHQNISAVPDELFADGAERRLREERGAELVTLDKVNFGLFDGAASLMQHEQTVSPSLSLRVGISLTSSI